MEFRASGFGFQVSGLWIRDSGFGIRVSGFGSRDSGFGIRDSGFGIRVSDFGFEVEAWKSWSSMLSGCSTIAFPICVLPQVDQKCEAVPRRARI